MDCSIVIPTYNTAAMTARCLRDLIANPPALAHEIIVVDNASSDGTVESLKQEFPTVLVIANPLNLGFAKACNLGARVATGRFLCFLNSDTEGAGPAVDTLAKWLSSHPGTGIVGPELLAPGGGIIQMSWAWDCTVTGELLAQYLSPQALRSSPCKRRLAVRLQRRTRQVPVIIGACLLVRRSAFVQIDGFDENFEMYFEDSDLCYRCRKAGWSVDFSAEAKVIHHLGQSSHGEWTITSLVYQQSHLAYYRKHSHAFLVLLLRGYLLLKWLRLRYRAWRTEDDKARAQTYCRAHRQMLTGRGKVFLSQGIPQR